MQLSTESVKLFEITSGALKAPPARTLMRLVPLGEPQPVHRSYPVVAEKREGLLGL